MADAREPNPLPAREPRGLTVPALAFRIDLRAAGAHRIAVELTIEPGCWPDPRACELFLPVWTPGSYLIREHQRHLEELSAVGGSSGAAIACSKSAKNRYLLAARAANEAVIVRYAVHAHELSVRTADLTEDHAVWSAACLCLWPVGGNDLPASVEVTAPDGWTLHTSLPRDASGRLRARDLDELVDMPCLAGTPQVMHFEALGKPHEFVLDGLAGIKPRESLVRDTVRIIERAAAIFGGTLPYEHYRFLTLFSDSGHGGLEHRDSSVLLAARTLFEDDKSYQEFMGLVAHEFFHVWNVKRMRPRELWTLDYERENHTELLWVAEGFTAYYDDLLCRRAGVVSRERYLEILAEGIGRLARNPGRRVHALAQASFDAWIKLYRPDENTRNSTQSYYTNGALAALCLDLRVRELTRGARSLDDVVRALYARTFEAGRGYDEADVRACLQDAAGRDLGPFLDELVHGPFDPDFDSLLAPFGVRIGRSVRQGIHLGVEFQSGSTRLHSVERDSPAMAGGLSAGDEILALGGLRVRSRSFKTVLGQIAQAGRPLEILLARRGRVLTRTVTPTTNPPGVLRLELIEDASEAQLALRRGWLAE